MGVLGGHLVGAEGAYALRVWDFAEIEIPDYSIVVELVSSCIFQDQDNEPPGIRRERVVIEDDLTI